MALVSSFELLVQPIIPTSVSGKKVAPSGLPNPFTVQAYFLMISNLGRSGTGITLDIEANFNPLTSGQNPLNGAGGIVPSGAPGFGPTTAFIDIYQPQYLSASGASGSYAIDPRSTQAKAFFEIPANGTGLFLLQPDIRPLVSFKSGGTYSYDVRGTVQIFADSGSQFLLSPQIRGTFLQPDEQGSIPLPRLLSTATDCSSQEEIDAMGGTILDAYSQQSYQLSPAGVALDGNPVYTF